MKFSGFKIFIALLVCVFFLQAMPLSVAEDKRILYKNQRQSSIDWGNINIKKFLSLKEWKDKSDDEDQYSVWETISSQRNNREVVGRFLQCIGSCRIDRGETFFNPHFSTPIYEGDEVQTSGDSFAWIFLLDGTMVRLSAASSVNFNEINIGIKENFLNARVNTGNVLWLSRDQSLFEESNVRETDVLFNPLAIYEAQPITINPKYNEADLGELLSENQTILNQYKTLNELIGNNNKITHGKPTYAFIVMPNATIMGYNPSVEMISLLGGKSFIKKRSALLLGLKSNEEGDETNSEDLLLQHRGFENTELTNIESDIWLEIDERGRSASSTDTNAYWLSMGEFITKRIPSILVARELLVTKYSEVAFREKYDPSILASEDGYRLWGEIKSADENKPSDLKLRIDYIKEYFRRIETTNLLVANQFKEKMSARGESIIATEYGRYFFQKPLEKYYSYEKFEDKVEIQEELNSTTKLLWKKMHGIR